MDKKTYITKNKIKQDCKALFFKHMVSPAFLI